MELELEQVLAEVWARLTTAATDSPLRRPALATVGVDGRPNARTVLLSGVSGDPPTLWVDTDLRTPKVAELERQPHALVLFHDPASRIQLRLAARTRVRRNGVLVDAHWGALSDAARLPYFTLHPPGTRAPSPTTDLPGGGQDAAPAAGRAHFAVIEFAVERLDWLQFAGRRGHRAAFTWGPSGGIEACWLVP